MLQSCIVRLCSMRLCGTNFSSCRQSLNKCYKGASCNFVACTGVGQALRCKHLIQSQLTWCDQVIHETKRKEIPGCPSFRRTADHRVSTSPTMWRRSSTHHWHLRMYRTWLTLEHTWTSNANHLYTDYHHYDQRGSNESKISSRKRQPIVVKTWKRCTSFLTTSLL